MRRRVLWRFQRKLMSRYPYEGIFVTVVSTVAVTLLVLGLKALAKVSGLGWFLLICLIIFAVLLIIGRWLDIRDAARLKSAQRSLPPVLDLPRSDYRSLSLPEKQE